MRTVPCGLEELGVSDTLDTRREETVGWMLKYPAVKSQWQCARVGDEVRRRSTLVTASYSVEVSGFRSGVNCATG